MAKLKLIPVVEIVPYRLSDRAAPEGEVEPHGPVSRAKWESYLEACRRDVGLDGLPPVSEGSLMVAVDALESRHLRTLMVNEAEALEAATRNDTFKPDEMTVPLDGGVAIEIDGAIVSEPGCCCDLADWFEWQEEITSKRVAWSEIWNGHDATSVQLIYRPETDMFGVRVGAYESGEWDVTLDIEFEELSACVARLRSTLEAIASRVEPLVPHGVPPRGAPEHERQRFAAQVVGLESINHVL